MTTPLVWKSCELSNRYYNAILKYKSFIYIDPDKHKVFLTSDVQDRVGLYFYIFSLAGILLCFLDVLYEIFVSKTIKVSLAISLLNTLETLLVSLVVVLLSVWLPNLQLLCLQYYNTLINHEINVCHGEHHKIRDRSLESILKQGKN